MTILNDKINSYAIEKGIEFNETYVLPPTETGSLSQNAAGDWTVITGVAPTYQSAVGPIGGGGSWKFDLSAGGTAGSRIRCNNAATLAIFNDRDYTAGCWVNFSQLPTGTAEASVPIMLVSNIFTAGFGIYVSGATSTYSNRFSVTTSSSAGNLDTGISCNANRWYFISVIVDGTSTKYYIDGVEVISATRTLSTNAAALFFGAPNSDSNNAILNISNAFIAPASTVTASNLAQIYTAGSEKLVTADPATADALMVDPVLDVQTSILIQETPAIASSDSLDPSIIADKEFIFNAAPAESNFELLLPSWSPPPPAPLYTLPGSLRDKIATYPIEYGVEFGAKTGSPLTGVSVYGSRATAATTDLQGFSSGVYAYSVDGSPASDANSYLLGPGLTRLYPYSSTTAAAIRPIWQDFNYTIGFWFKLDTLPTGTNSFALPLARIRTTANETVNGGEFSVFVSGSSNATHPSKLVYSFYNQSTTFPSYPVGSTLNATDWNYLALRRTSATNINNFEVYLNGQLVDTKTNADTAVYQEFQFGVNTSNSGFKIQNLHMATASALTSYEIGQIWIAGTTQEPATPVDAIYPPEPIYVNATIVDGTYIATRPDSTNIATSFPLDALMVLPAWSNATESRYTADVIELNATLGDNIGLDTFADRIVPSEALTATIDIVDPLLSRFAFAGSALFVDPVVSIAPNYLTLVKNLNPVFYIQDGQSVPEQLGSWPVSSWDVDDITPNVNSGEEMGAVGNGKSWQAVSNLGGQQPKLKAIVPNYMQRRADLYATRSLSLEVWYYSVAAGTVAGNAVESGPIFTDGTTQIGEVFDFWGNSETGPASNTHLLIGDLIKNYDFVGEGANAYATWRGYYGSPKRNAWNHVVVTYEPLASPTQVRQKVYLNGSIISNLALNIRYDLADRRAENITFPTVNDAVTWDGPQIGWVQVLSGSQTIVQETGVKTDEFAIYDRTLSENEVYSHYTFIRNLTPDADYEPIVYALSAQSGDHQVLPVQNALYQETPFSGLAGLIPEPDVIGGKSKTLFPTEFEMLEIELLEPTVSLDKVLSAEIIPVYAELNNHFVSNNTYYQYVKTNIDPYRYVNFDSANSLIDHGIDNSYSVVPTSIGGTVVSHDLGINNKSVKTAGSTYSTDGVILKESEWNDSWGTGQNSYHSAFWFQRAADDQSINGLRVLWNLNGYKDNQHVVLYQYQGKLHMQFNNGSGTFVEQDTAALDLFDYNRHFILIEFDHTNNNNNVVKLYVDAVLRSTINLGAYTGSTTNATVADSGANFEANNHPRLGIGCLITPFGSTALPAVPTNTKLIVDEIYWDKNAITQTAVTNLYNAMPAKTNTVNASDPLTASTELVMPNVSGDAIFVTTPATCDIDIVDPTIFANFVVQLTVQPMTASAEILDAERSDSVNIVAEFMLASAALGLFGTPRLLLAGVMEASFALQDRPVTGTVTLEGSGIRVNGIRTFAPITIWADYVTSSAFSEYIIPMKEVV
jgi:hypothetical protein